ncbi:SH3 domain-containing protein [Roseibium sp.]
MSIRLPLALMALVLTVLPAAAQSRPAIAYTTANLNMRTGPGTNYPVVTTVPNGGGVTVFGCTADYRWCDSAFANARGWVSGRYLSYGVQGSYYGRPIPNAGVYIGVPLYRRNYPVYTRPPIAVQPVRPHYPYYPRYPYRRY